MTNRTAFVLGFVLGAAAGVAGIATFNLGFQYYYLNEVRKRGLFPLGEERDYNG